jgi:peptidoglycan/LPS O-acetylase OafA/YrhL
VLNGVLYPMAMSSYPDIYGRTVHNFFLFWFPAQLPVFLLGILLYRMILAADPKKDGVLAFPLLALAGLVIVGSFKSFSFLNLLPQHVLFSAGLLLFAFSLYLRPRLLFVNPVTIFLGKISFSLYLVHFALLDPMETLVRAHSLGNPDLDSLLYFILVLIPASGLAWITHRWIELPGIRLGSALIRRWEKTAS